MVDYKNIMNCPNQDMNQEGMPIYILPQTPPHEHLMPRGRNCSVYDSTAPTGFKFFNFHTRSLKNKSPGQLKEDLKAKLMELKLNTEKSPVAKLNEIMFLKRKILEYELVSMVGNMHSPIFTFRIKSDELVVYGSGPSKKEAKKNAAIAFLEKIDCCNSINTITSTTSSVSPIPFIEHSEDHIKKIIETKSEVNPVGLLQEMCMARHWALPNYEYSKDGQNSVFTVYCNLKNFKTFGEGKIKQSAKKDAAFHMYKHFKDSVPEKIITPYYGEYQSPIKTLMNNNNLPIDENDTKQQEILPTSEVIKSLEIFMDTLKLSNKTGLNKLKQIDLVKEFNISAIDILDQIGKEEGFESKYVLVSNKSPMGILVQVSITPQLVNIGLGKTVEEAQEKAAFCILMYLKVLLEK